MHTPFRSCSNGCWNIINATAFSCDGGGSGGGGGGGGGGQSIARILANCTPNRVAFVHLPSLLLPFGCGSLFFLSFTLFILSLYNSRFTACSYCKHHRVLVVQTIVAAAATTTTTAKIGWSAKKRGNGENAHIHTLHLAN